MKIYQRLILIIAFIVALSVIIAYARGYRIDFEKKTLSSTGILAITSTPKAAKIYVNGELKGVTDSNFTLSPGSYNVEMKKDGYTSWSKKVTLKGELVLTLDGLLFPLNPSLSPLTNLGIRKAVPLSQTDKVLLSTETGDETKDGMYLFEGKRQLLPLSPLKRIALKKNLPALTDFTSVTVYLSPDLKQVIVESPKDKTAYLLSLEEENTNAFDITTSKDALLEAWKTEKEKEYLKILETFPKEVAKIASDSFHIIAFSPNETKLLYTPEKAVLLPSVITPPLIASNQTKDVRKLQKNHVYVYDKKEDRNYEISLPSSIIYDLSSVIQWYSDSKHLLLNESNKISVIDYDGTNKQTIYSGPFDNSFFNVTGDGGLIVLLNLNPEANKFPDLYAVGIK